MITAIVMVNVERKAVGSVMEQLINIDGITEVYPITGEYDIVAIIRTNDSSTLSRIVADIMPHNIDDIIHTKTFIALDCKAKIDIEKAYNL